MFKKAYLNFLRPWFVNLSQFMLQSQFKPIDIYDKMVYLSYSKEVSHGSLLREVPLKEGDEESQSYDHEEQKARYHRYLSHLRD